MPRFSTAKARAALTAPERGVTVGSKRVFPDPATAGNAVEFVALLRARKERANVTYRQLEMNAAASGDVLPRSTLADVLQRATLPHEEHLRVFLRACGCTDREVAVWTAARRRLAAAGEGSTAASPPAGPPDPHPGASRPRRLRYRAMLLALVAAGGVLLAVTAAWTVRGTPNSGDSRLQAPSASAQGGPVAAGEYRIHPVHSYPDRCLDGTGEGSDSLAMVVEWTCTGSRDQVFAVERVSADLYRARPANTIRGAGPWCAAFASSVTGSLWLPRPCRDDDPRQYVKLEPVRLASHAGRPAYSMRTARGDACVTVGREIDRNDVAEVAQHPCMDSPRQQFVLVPVPGTRTGSGGELKALPSVPLRAS
ncbi:hypothetical protein Srubr_08390 [Streptomyces rubradiris]|uniref:XRE family transcriptional regulator n=1 Tax=Streptomyces rubradiris TaxID=285531 RepID=A0ABQ3R558_STRRR|nr:hypothetical protein GCM10018792_67650 [Streptomyces rubradiris]GHI50993.1 hypothetical protein Srubr_08390 [Streptomyces rubradiris]